MDEDLRTEAASDWSDDFWERLLLERDMAAEDLDGVGGATDGGTATNTGALGSVVTPEDAPPPPTPLLPAVDIAGDLLLAVEAAEDLLPTMEPALDLGGEVALVEEFVETVALVV